MISSDGRVVNEPIEFEEMLGKLMRRKALTLFKKNLKFPFHMSSLVLRRYLGNSSAIIDVMNSLVDNAINHSPEGRNPYVNLDVIHDPFVSDQYHNVVVTFHDFGKNRSTDSSFFSWDMFEDSQADLKKARRIVESLHGSLRVEYVSSYGTVVTVQLRLQCDPTLPRRRAKDMQINTDFLMESLEMLTQLRLPTPTKPSIPQLTPPTSKASSMQSPYESRVLVVDDADSNRYMLCRLLAKKYHVEVEEASSGEECIELVEEAMRVGECYKLIILDNFMPKMTGPEAIHHLRNVLGYKGIVFGLTGMVLNCDIKHFLDCGCDEVLAKPFDAGKFLELAKKHKIIS
jgi:CheY-like chemotaxis protein